MVIKMVKKLVYGVGLNDADYVVHSRANGKRVMCPFYLAWSSMLERCYDAKYQSKRPTYIGCSVCDDWLIFSNFKSWMEKQDWKDKQLDKDLLVKWNKTYSPDTCVFVDNSTNGFTKDSGAARGEHPIGVCFHKEKRKFAAKCCNSFTGKQEHLGYFTCSKEAHLAWRKRKHELACQLADMQTDERVAKALRARYL